MSTSKKIFLAVFALFIVGLNIALYSWAQSLEAEEVPYLKNEVIERLTFDNQNRLWAVVFQERASHCTSADGNVSYLTSPELGVYENGVMSHTYTGIEAGCHSRQLQDFIVDSSGRAWINWKHYVAVGDGDDWQEVPLDMYKPDSRFLSMGIDTRSITKIAIDSQGEPWIGTANDGLFIMDEGEWKNYTTENSDLLGNAITDIAFDKEGRAWIASYSLGLNIFDGENWQSYTLGNSPLLSSRVTSIAFDNQNRAWVGTDKEIAVFDGKDWVSYSTDKVDLGGNGQIVSMVFDGQGRVWANDTNVFDGKTWKYYFDPYHWRVNDTAVDNDGNIWVATDNGVVVIRPGSPQPVSYGIGMVALVIASGAFVYLTLLFLIICISLVFNTWRSIGSGLLGLPVWFIWIFTQLSGIHMNRYNGILGPDNIFILNPAIFGSIGGIVGGTAEIYFKSHGGTNTKKWGLIGFVAGTVISFCAINFPYLA